MPDLAATKILVIFKLRIDVRFFLSIRLTRRLVQARKFASLKIRNLSFYSFSPIIF